MSTPATTRGRRDLAARDTDLRELMDDPACDPVRLAATLRRFDAVNRLVAGWASVYRRQIRPHLGGRPQARVLDLGCGGGDVMVRLAERAAREGLRAEWVGVDPDERAIAVARSRSAPAGVSFRVTDADALVRAGERFDIVLSNHVLHHLDTTELRDFTAASRRLSQGLVLHSDIERSRRAYALYAIGITPLAPGSFLRTDGLRSIRRSHRAAELAAALGPAWTMEHPAPFRLLARAEGTADA